MFTVNDEFDVKRTPEVVFDSSPTRGTKPSGTSTRNQRRSHRRN
jgi:hypothetical protein